ncbi:Phycocyanin (plasmid) [Thalassoporum mexicanum PCC 7367]|uniref:phycocyanin n=1 Tax=Thalassoporum mexicanum TaxID=3457544 RepID=UPI00029F8B0A|nr:phycocyanin [Pseudanabaena sp. PCC 7367]AFY72111.1 Phycocyanin [Pseudanabaena sp. PCC 7367]
MDALKQSIEAAREQGRFLDQSQMERFRVLFQKSEARLYIAKLITAHAAELVEAVTSNHTNSDGIACLYCADVLRHITYSLLAGNESILEDDFLDRLIKDLVSLAGSIEPFRQAIGALKNALLELLNAPTSRNNINQDYYGEIVNKVANDFDIITAHFRLETHRDRPQGTSP